MILISFCIGTLFPILLNVYNFKVYEEGIEYYAEVHTTCLNSVIHTIFMPVTAYGLLLCIPQILYLSKQNSIKFQRCLYIIYMTHYIQIDIIIGLLLSLVYYLPLYFSIKTYQHIENKRKIGAIGLVTSTTALTIQEVFGHWYSGDKPSRPEAIPNAIMYAIYYSISHLFDGTC